MDTMQISASAQLGVYALTAFGHQLQVYSQHLLHKPHTTFAIKMIDLEKIAKHT